jgi:hypothetical protein
MERESFQDEEIAAVLNEHFVCIKVDREQRPDVDHVYMTALQVFQRLTGSGQGGGWPLTMFLTPDGEPFFGGTYFPPRDGQRGFTSGLLTILRRVNQVWQEKEQQVRQDAQVITRVTRSQLNMRMIALDSRKPTDTAAWRALWDKVDSALYEQFDPQYGGFGFDAQAPAMPKFPEPPNLFYLLDRCERLQAQNEDFQRTFRMLETTLTQMALGGIRDHLAGGFHRYSVDRFWRVPHFEKMLYDNAQLLSVYSRAYGLTKNPLYRQTADEMANFLLHEMKDASGGFYSAIDAESEGAEGQYYIWDAQEIRQLLDSDSDRLFITLYQLDQPPQFEDKWYVLQLARPLHITAREIGMSLQELQDKLETSRRKLLERRQTRPKPAIDTKIIVAWNGMALRGLVDGARYLQREDLKDAAITLASFLSKKCVTSDGKLVHSVYDGQPHGQAFLDDYAFTIDGLLSLYQITNDREWLDLAVRLQQSQDSLFWDESAKDYYFTSTDHERLVAKIKIWTDNVWASGNCKSLLNLWRLGQTTSSQPFIQRAEQLLETGWAWLDQFPAAAPELGRAIAERYVNSAK